eukprot:3150931-Pleurochrysis_carterae.AAC.1
MRKRACVFVRGDGARVRARADSLHVPSHACSGNLTESLLLRKAKRTCEYRPARAPLMMTRREYESAAACVWLHTQTPKKASQASVS